jgi:hypothetical protein
MAILVNTELTFSVVDSSGNIVLTFVGCTADNYSSNISANVPISESTNFSCLDILDINGVSILNDGGDALLVNAVGAAASALASAI